MRVGALTVHHELGCVIDTGSVVGGQAAVIAVVTGRAEILDDQGQGELVDQASPDAGQ